VLVAVEVAQQLACVSLETADAGQVTQVLALCPAAQGRELAPAGVVQNLPFLGYTRRAKTAGL